MCGWGILLVIWLSSLLWRKMNEGEKIWSETWKDSVRNLDGAVFRQYQTKFGAENCFENGNIIRIIKEKKRSIKNDRKLEKFDIMWSMKKLIIELELFSGNSKPNLDRKVVVSIEIIEEICRYKKKHWNWWENGEIWHVVKFEKVLKGE